MPKVAKVGVNGKANAKQHTISSKDCLEPDTAAIIILDDFRQSIHRKPDVTRQVEIVYFLITVDSHLTNKAEGILRTSCGTSLSEIKLETVERKHQTRLWVHLKAAAYGIALHAIILGLPSAEFGSVTHMHVPAVTV